MKNKLKKEQYPAINHRVHLRDSNLKHAMERKYYRDNFEIYLKDQADEFKLYPSQRVWHGIYNDFHPGRRWPSLATMLFIVSFLVVLNGYNAHRHLITISNGTPILVASNSTPLAAISIASSTSSSMVKDNIINNSFSTDQKPSLPQEKNIVSTSESESQSLEIAQPLRSASLKITNVNQQTLLVLPINLKDKTTQNPILNPSLHLGKKYASKFSISYYVAPSITYRRIFNNITSTSSTFAASSATPALFAPDNSDYGKQQPVIGFEVGSNVNYRLNSNFKINTGLQLSYSGYDIAANNIHPRETAFLVNDDGQPREVSATSFFGNDPQGDSKVTLHNYSWQASIPIGMEYRIAGNDNLSISAAANVLPTYVISSNAYLLSEDRHSYVNYPSVMRDFNVNTEVGTYVSFGLNKFRWEVGPHFRYQLLSTYNNSSPYGEHLFNYGIRFGISKRK